MKFRLVTSAALALTALIPGVAAAGDDGHGNGKGPPPWAHGSDAEKCEPTWSVWVTGHYEKRECVRILPAVTREVYVPERCEVVVIPAVTQRVRIPAVIERVRVPAVTERCWVPEVRDRCWVPGHWESRTDANGCACRVWIGGHYEERIVRAGRYEERVLRAECWEERIVRAECWEVRIVAPERRETRVVEKAHCETVVVRPERREVTVEKVWVPGCWVERPRPVKS